MKHNEIILLCHHQLNYKPFKKNKLIKKKNIEIKKGINNYGMIIKEFKEKMHITKIQKYEQSTI
jgi:hypothetical protein